MSERKKPGIAFWATVVVVAIPVLYVASFGPACWWFSPPRSDGTWMMSSSDLDPWAPKAYWPLGWLAEYGPEPVSGVIQWFALLKADRVWVATSPDGNRTCIGRFE